eukprot:6416265-Prymnesium_polylepis.1
MQCAPSDAMPTARARSLGGAVYQGETFNETLEEPPPPSAPPPAPAVVSKSGCACSGYNNSHGFGAHCGPWEYVGQVPWCYVHLNCSNPTGAAKGSFGHPYDDCAEPTPPPPPPPPPDAAA